MIGDDLTEVRLHLEDPGPAGTHPTRATAYERRSRRLLLQRVDHAEVGEHAEHPEDAGRDGPLVEAPRLTTLIEEDTGTALAGGVAERAVAQLGVIDHRRTEGLGERTRRRIVEVAADLREIGAAVGAGVQVDADLTLVDDLGHEEVGDAAGQRAAGRSGETPVEVAAVGEIAVTVHEADDVDDGHGEQGPADRLGVDLGHDPSDHLDPDDLVAVDGSTDPDRRAFVATMDDVDGKADVRAGDETGDREADLLGHARANLDRADGEGGPGLPPPLRPNVLRAVRAHDLPQLRRRVARIGRPPAYDSLLSTTKPCANASRPMSIRKPISSRSVSVTSAVIVRPASARSMSTTSRSSA